ncbi:MAG: cell division protein SepF [Fusobacteriota bacterium]
MKKDRSEDYSIIHITLQPTSLDNVTKILDHIIFEDVVTVNLNKLDKDEQEKIIDIISGTVYAVNANIIKVGEGVFIITPEKVQSQNTTDMR